MRWQKARLIGALEEIDWQYIGRTLWVECREPFFMDQLVQTQTREPRAGCKVLPTNITNKGEPVVVNMSDGSWELLPEFADDVPMITWQQYAG